jgi:hypothetical protein
MKVSTDNVPHFLRVVRALARVRGAAIPVAAVVTTVVAGLHCGPTEHGVVCFGRCGETTTGAGGESTGTDNTSSSGLGFFPMDAGPQYDGGPVGIPTYDGGPVGDMTMPDAGDGGKHLGVGIMPDGGHDGG